MRKRRHRKKKRKKCRSCFEPCMSHLSFMHACIMQARWVRKPKERPLKRPKGYERRLKHACKIASSTCSSIPTQQMYLTSSFAHVTTRKASHHVCMYQVHVMLPSGWLQSHMHEMFQMYMHVHVCTTPSFGGFGFTAAVAEAKKMPVPKPPSHAPPAHIR